MATATTKTAPRTETPDISRVAQKMREQLLATVQQGQQLSIDAAETWVKAVSVIPVPDLNAVPGLPTVPGVEDMTTFTFDLAADLLSSQRDFALALAKVLVPATSA